MITLGLVDSVDDNGVYVTMPGARGVLRGPYRCVNDVAVGSSVLIEQTDDGEQVVVGSVTAPPRSGFHNIRDYGAVGDGATDDSAAIQSALDAASAAHATVVVPPGTYRVLSTLNVGSDTTIVGTGTIDAVIPGDENPVFWIHADDVCIEGISVVGNKAEYAEVTEFKHGFSICSSNRVTLRDVTTTDNKGDGVLISAGEVIGSGEGDPSTAVVLENVVSEYNHRQGLSIVAGVDVRVLGGSFSYTSGTLPQSGIDIEPDNTDHSVEAISIIGVSTVSNAGSGILIALRDADNHAGITISGGRSADNDGHGVGVLSNAARSIVVENMVVENNVGGVVCYNVDLYGMRILNNLIRNNSQPGVWIAYDDGAPASCEGLAVVGNTILDNYTYGLLALISGPIVTAYNRIGNTGGGTYTQTYGIYTQYVTAETHLGNELTGNTTAGASYGGTASGRTVVGPEGVGFFGATPAAKQTVTGSRGGNAALASLLTGLANLGLITDSSS